MKCLETSAGRARRIKLSFYLLSFVLLFLVAGPSLAQEPTFRSQSNIVIVPALVQDATGRVIYGLHAADFLIEDNGVAQAVQLDESADAEPISLMVAIQTGRRAGREFGRVQGLSSMLAPILDQPHTQIAVLTFDSQLKLAQDFTGDARQIADCLHNLEAGDGGAAILDAVQYSVRLLNKAPEGTQKVLLLISETRDHGSHFAKIDDVVTLIGNSNATVYTLAFSPTLSNILDTERGNNADEMTGVNLIDLLAHARAAMKSNSPKAIASQTGGEYELFESRKKFESRMIDFTNHLHNRYVLSFEPKNPQPGLHQIKVRLREPGTATILARSNYWVYDTAP
jgi:VWFA-related protein